MGACKLANNQTTFRENVENILLDIRSCKNATTDKTPYELLFAREKNSVLSNLVNLLDARRLLKKGHWRHGREASYHHVTDRDSESDTNLEEEAFIQIVPNKNHAERNPTPTSSRESDADVTEIISDNESMPINSDKASVIEVDHTRVSDADKEVPAAQ